MGLMMSVLVFSVGVLEALSCVDHIRHGYLPLDIGRKRRRLVLDVGSGTIRHRETRRRSSEIQRDARVILEKVAACLKEEEEDCEELAAIFEKVEAKNIHSSHMLLEEFQGPTATGSVRSISEGDRMSSPPSIAYEPPYKRRNRAKSENCTEQALFTPINPRSESGEFVDDVLENVEHENTPDTNNTKYFGEPELENNSASPFLKFEKNLSDITSSNVEEELDICSDKNYLKGIISKSELSTARTRHNLDPLEKHSRQENTRSTNINYASSAEVVPCQPPIKGGSKLDSDQDSISRKNIREKENNEMETMIRIERKSETAELELVVNMSGTDLCVIRPNRETKHPAESICLESITDQSEADKIDGFVSAVAIVQGSNVQANRVSLPETVGTLDGSFGGLGTHCNRNTIESSREYVDDHSSITSNIKATKTEEKVAGDDSVVISNIVEAKSGKDEKIVIICDIEEAKAEERDNNDEQLVVTSSIVEPTLEMKEGKVEKLVVICDIGGAKAEEKDKNDEKIGTCDIGGAKAEEKDKNNEKIVICDIGGAKAEEKDKNDKKIVVTGNIEVPKADEGDDSVVISNIVEAKSEVKGKDEKVVVTCDIEEAKSEVTGEKIVVTSEFEVPEAEEKDMDDNKMIVTSNIVEKKSKVKGKDEKIVVTCGIERANAEEKYKDDEEIVPDLLLQTCIEDRKSKENLEVYGEIENCNVELVTCENHQKISSENLQIKKVGNSVVNEEIKNVILNHGSNIDPLGNEKTLPCFELDNNSNKSNDFLSESSSLEEVKESFLTTNEHGIEAKLSESSFESDHEGKVLHQPSLSIEESYSEQKYNKLSDAKSGSVNYDVCDAKRETNDPSVVNAEDKMSELYFDKYQSVTKEDGADLKSIVKGEVKEPNLKDIVSVASLRDDESDSVEKMINVKDSAKEDIEGSSLKVDSNDSKEGLTEEINMENKVKIDFEKLNDGHGKTVTEQSLMKEVDSEEEITQKSTVFLEKAAYSFENAFTDNDHVCSSKNEYCKQYPVENGTSANVNKLYSNTEATTINEPLVAFSEARGNDCRVPDVEVHVAKDEITIPPAYSKDESLCNLDSQRRGLICELTAAESDMEIVNKSFTSHTEYLQREISSDRESTDTELFEDALSMISFSASDITEDAVTVKEELTDEGNSDSEIFDEEFITNLSVTEDEAMANKTITERRDKIYIQHEQDVAAEKSSRLVDKSKQKCMNQSEHDRMRDTLVDVKESLKPIPNTKEEISAGGLDLKNGQMKQELVQVAPRKERVIVLEELSSMPCRLSPVEDLTSPDKAFWLIFSGEYTKAMSKDWHSGHFCCWQCDESLTGQRYVLRDDHPYCIKCYEQVFANTCDECSKVIGIDSKDLSYKDKHWHEACFLCSKCRVSLVDKQFGSKADKIYCGNCYDAQFASRCDGCGQIFRAGTKKMEYKTRQWHEQCFCCCVCKSAIGTKSFIPREQEIYCATCYEEKFATRCVKCNKIITSGGVTYKNEPWHRECFTCTNCSTSLAGQRFTSRDEKPYCADCFGELFAKRCTACCKPITGIGGTRFISFEDRHWHNDCFICASCKSSLVGRGFITDAEDILCTECAKAKLM